MLHLLREFTLLGLPRHCQTLAVNVEQPAMVGTANTAIFDVAVFQGGAAMRAALANQTERAVGIAKQNQILAQNSHRLRDVVQFLSRADDQPVTAKPFPRRRSRTDVGDIRDRNFSVFYSFSVLHGQTSSNQLFRSRFKGFNVQESRIRNAEYRSAIRALTEN